jgi:hypothetical protein
MLQPSGEQCENRLRLSLSLFDISTVPDNATVTIMMILDKLEARPWPQTVLNLPTVSGSESQAGRPGAEPRWSEPGWPPAGRLVDGHPGPCLRLPSEVSQMATSIATPICATRER